MLSMQGIGAALAGTVAQLTSPATAMTLVAVASLAVTVVLAVLGRQVRGRYQRCRRLKAPAEVSGSARGVSTGWGNS